MKTVAELESACGNLNMEQIGIICDYVHNHNHMGEGLSWEDVECLHAQLLEIDSQSEITLENVEAQIELSLRELLN